MFTCKLAKGEAVDMHVYVSTRAGDVGTMVWAATNLSLAAWKGPLSKSIHIGSDILGPVRVRTPASAPLLSMQLLDGSRGGTRTASCRCERTAGSRCGPQYRCSADHPPTQIIADNSTAWLTAVFSRDASPPALESALEPDAAALPPKEALSFYAQTSARLPALCSGGHTAWRSRVVADAALTRRARDAPAAAQDPDRKVLAGR